MLDLPRDADISALVLRFGGECELVWLNDKNALAVFSDPARAATALRRLDHSSVYQGAVAILQNGGASGGNAWGGGGAAAAAAVKSGNPWKKALAPDSDSWGVDWPAVADAAVTVWKGNEVAPISVRRGTDGIFLIKMPRRIQRDPSRDSAPSLQVPDGGVDDWEEACE